MNTELERLNSWFKANRLCLNVSKTRYVLFGPQCNRKTLDHRNLQMNGEDIKQIHDNGDENSFKFLGIHMDEHLTWKHHIQKVCKKIASANYMIGKAREFLPQSTLKNLYTSLVHSHINYGLLLWGSGISIDKLIKTQKRSIRIICGKSFRQHSEPLFKESEIMKVTDQYKVNAQLFMYQLKNGLLPNSFKHLNYFSHEHNHCTRGLGQAYSKTARTRFSSLLPYHRLPCLWNGLPIHIQDIESCKLFKIDLKKLYLSTYRDAVVCESQNCRQCHPIS